MAGLEALAALSATARGLIETTLIGADTEFAFAAHSTQQPFAGAVARRYSLEEICRDHDATFVHDAVTGVDVDRHRVATRAGDEFEYDSLLLAVGAQREPVFEGHAIVFRGHGDTEAVHGLVQDLESGYVKRAVFVVPSGTTWPLPLYELALMCANRTREMGQRDASFVFITPEEIPLLAFGRNASSAVRQALEDAGVELLTDSYVDRISGGDIEISPSGRLIPGGRLVTVPRLVGPQIAGVPSDDHGFIPVDAHGKVDRAADVYAAGDGTTFPVKQGGIAAQQADAAALAIARAAGANVEVRRFDPVLRAKLLTGAGTRYLRDALGPDGGEETSVASDRSLWWPPAKVAAPYLTGYVEGL